MKLDYVVQTRTIKNNCYLTDTQKFYYESEENFDVDKLCEEIINKHPGKVIISIVPYYLSENAEGEQKKDSEKRWNEFYKSREYIVDTIQNQYKQILKITQDLINEVTKNNLQDTQEYLDFLDELNKLSVSS